MGLVFEILLPLVFYLVYYCHKGFVKPFAGIFIFLGSIRKRIKGKEREREREREL